MLDECVERCVNGWVIEVFVGVGVGKHKMSIRLLVYIDSLRFLNIRLSLSSFLFDFPSLLSPLLSCWLDCLVLYLDLAISLAALIKGASVRRGSQSLKKGCYGEIISHRIIQSNNPIAHLQKFSSGGPLLHIHF